MNNQTEKLRQIYIPFLIIGLSIIVGYTFLNWLTMIYLQSFPFKEKIVNNMPPFIISYIAVLIWLRPRIKLLKLGTIGNFNLRITYSFIAAFAITAPTIIAQNYMVTATGKLTVLDNISHIERHVATKYYSLKNYFVDKKDFQTYTTTEVTGKHSEDLKIDVYIVCPLLPSKPAFYEETDKSIGHSCPLLVVDGKPYRNLEPSAIPTEKILSSTKLSNYVAFQIYGEIAKNGAILLTTNHFIPVIKDSETKTRTILPDTLKSWLGYKYSDCISNRISNQEQEKLIKTFRSDSKNNFELKDISKFVYLKRLGNSDEVEDYQNAICNSPLIQSSKIILLPINEPFESRNGNKFDWIYLSFGIGALLWLIMILYPELENKDMIESEFDRHENNQW